MTARSVSAARVGHVALGEQLGALVHKELICFWRDPLLKALIFQRLVYLALVVVLNTTSARQGSSSLGMSSLTLLLIFFFTLSLSLNTLGIERQCLTTLLLFPVNRRRLLWGKNLAVGLMGLVILLVVTAIGTSLSHQPQAALPTFIIGLAGFGVALGVANVMAVNFPRYQRGLGRRGLAGAGNASQTGGCLNTIMALVGVLTSFVLVSPVALSIGLPYVFNQPVIWLASMPLSLAYGATLYILLTNLSARRLLNRVPEILAVTTRER
jgi:ABC-type Na+ efflux pump permease subunit